eukprot:UN12032
MYKNKKCTQNETLILIAYIFNNSNCTISIPQKERFIYDYSIVIAHALNGTISEIGKDLDECNDIMPKKDDMVINFAALFGLIFIVLMTYYCYKRKDRKYSNNQAQLVSFQEMTDTELLQASE